jgi:hypothetical protein
MQIDEAKRDPANRSLCRWPGPRGAVIDDGCEGWSCGRDGFENVVNGSSDGEREMDSFHPSDGLIRLLEGDGTGRLQSLGLLGTAIPDMDLPPARELLQREASTHPGSKDGNGHGI